MTAEAEEWRAVVGWEGLYEVSSLGRVRSLDRVAEWPNLYGGITRRKQPGKVLSGGVIHDGYRLYTLYKKGQSHQVTVHRLICIAFLGPPPSRFHQARHLDGDRANNILMNLAWGTVQDNADDRRAHGTMLNGTKSPHAKLTDHAVRHIRSTRDSSVALAQLYGVSKHTVRRARQRRTWKHLP